MRINDQLDEMDVTIVAVGSGSPDQAGAFVEKSNFRGELYVDPSLAAYRAFGLKRGFWKTLGPASVVRGFKVMGRGFRQGKTAGDPWQQGGMFVLGPGKRLLFEHRNPSTGKQADLNAVLEAAAVR